ncbi:type II toxin-antitoxin system RelE family toxin [Candidatus Magnetomonas plexicatena]|uniref:type II toxin-antitoxin system RelE family toxin n=1 Tax=Candidatus Magnetomonas plexicatena TaxID=2552947 RepID=UPI001C74D710|nr:type II toxin-antitoxin system RelE/ParE family toxin [Nitrospirales bacterium LBB_01]
MYRVTFLPDAEKNFRKLDRSVQLKIAEKLDWLAENAEKIIHHPLVSLPEDLKGLCRIRVGNHRILYWIYHEEERISIYFIEHRRKVYNYIKQ